MAKNQFSGQCLSCASLDKNVVKVDCEKKILPESSRRWSATSMLKQWETTASICLFMISIPSDVCKSIPRSDVELTILTFFCNKHTNMYSKM
jgi:hypothetical protein